MSDHEVVATLVAALAAALGWVIWYRPFFTVPRLGARSRARTLLAYVPLACLALIFAVLRLAAASDVRGAPVYIAMYLILGAGWLALSAQVIGWVGVSARDDVVERDNEGAATAIAGALVAFTLCYAGGNIGDGPGFGVVLFSALLASGVLVALWRMLDRLAAVTEQITVERDAAAGARLAGFLIACGLILGRAVAGDWFSTEALVFDLVRGGWPVLVLLAVAVVMERRLRVTVEQPHGDRFAHGVLPALLYTILAAANVALVGTII